MQIKERKEMEDMFKKAQKPWGKHLAKVEKSKSDYHTSCKSEKSAANQERNATGDSSLSPDQVKHIKPFLIIKSQNTLSAIHLEIKIVVFFFF